MVCRVGGCRGNSGGFGGCHADKKSLFFKIAVTGEFNRDDFLLIAGHRDGERRARRGLRS